MTYVYIPIVFSDEVRERGFTVILDMRGSKWEIVKPILKALQVLNTQLINYQISAYVEKLKLQHA